MVYSLADMFNLARTRLILGSGYSSYSEVAAQMGGSRGAGLHILMAGRDFGSIVERRRGVVRRTQQHSSSSLGHDLVTDLAGFELDQLEEMEKPEYRVHVYWPQPFIFPGE